MSYTPRVLDRELEGRLTAVGAVVIEGPKACGKTSTARQVSASEVLLDVEPAARNALGIEPSIVLDGPTPRLIDEWQLEADIVWNHVRRIVDERRRPGQFILTGSAVPSADPSRHTGAGRFATLRMRPMSLWESGQSSGAISLKRLIDGDGPTSPDPGLTLLDLIDRICIGGWPASQGLTTRDAARAARDYLAQIRDVDVSRIAASPRDPARIGRLLTSVARNVASEAAISVLATDAAGPDGELSRNTVYDYLDLLRRLMVLEDQPAWSTHLRSRAVLREAPKRHFVDPSLAAAALGADPERLLHDLNTTGFLFESLVVRDLRIYAQPLDATVHHYRDSYGTEVDAIVQVTDGRWAAFEVKLNSTAVDEAASRLLRFVNNLHLDRVGQPSCLGVVTANGYGYTRPDGVRVIPIGALGP